jgi:type II secretory pathway component PulF
MAAASASRQFLFTAVTSAGTRKRGLRAAADRAELAESLSEDRLLLLRAWELPAWAGAGEQPMPLSDYLALNEQLALLVSRGVPLVESLSVAESVVSGRSQRRVKQMREKVAAGASFADACSEVGGFDEVSAAVYRAAERSGDLAPAAKRLAEAAKRRASVASRAKTMLLYPAFVAVVGVAVLALMIMVVVPTLGEALQQANAELPGYSKLVIDTGLWARGNLVWVMLAAGAVVIGTIAARRTLVPALANLARKIPVIEKASLAGELASLFAVLAAMSRSGVPLADSLAVSAKTIRHPKLRVQLEKLQTDLVEGGVFSKLIEKVDALPLATRKLLNAADRAGDLEPTFESLTEEYAERSEEASSRLLSLLGPAILVVVFFFVGAIVLALMIPLMNLSSAIQ